MSREQRFEWVVKWFILAMLIIACAAWLATLARVITIQRTLDRQRAEDAAQTHNPAPIFRCIGAGGGVVVSLGGDGKSIFLYCSDV